MQSMPNHNLQTLLSLEVLDVKVKVTDANVGYLENHYKSTTVVNRQGIVMY
jgi:hypothetical protein